MTALPSTAMMQRVPLTSYQEGFATPIGLERITVTAKNPPANVAFPAGTAFVLIFAIEGTGHILSKTRTMETLRNHITLLQCNRGNATWTPSPGFDGMVITVGNLAFRNLFGKQHDVLRPYFRDIIRTPDDDETPPVIYSEALSLAQRSGLTTMLNPPMIASVSSLWYQAKSMELLVTFACRNKDETAEHTLFCSHMKRQAQERVSVAKRYIINHIDSPLNLNEIAKAAACSPTYLSRTFSAETGITLRRFQRSIRVEAAMRLMRSGRYNVSEAAIEVGYTSFSHFTRAFTEEKGMTPSAFLKTL